MSYEKRIKAWVMLGGEPIEVEAWTRIVSFKETWVLAADGSFQTMLAPDEPLYASKEDCIAGHVSKR